MEMMIEKMKEKSLRQASGKNDLQVRFNILFFMGENIFINAVICNLGITLNV